jgi:hypothetical protein
LKKNLKIIFYGLFMGTLRDKNGTKNAQNSAFKYFCESCDYVTCKKSNYDTHILSDKHSMVTSGYKKGQLSADIQPKSDYFENETFMCNCGKQYKHRQGLWRHKKICISNTDPISDNKKLSELDKDELIITLLKQNAELIKGQQDMMVKLTESGITNTNHSHNTTTNSHNKAFNLNFFLNETCKNAMNITDFVDSIKLQLTDLMEVGELGYVEGISKIIVKNLNNLDETIRPVHCTDKKRETMYVKDQGEWSKEDDNKTRLKKAINKVADKNIMLLPRFREKYPEYRNSASKISDVHDKLVIEVMETSDDKKEKIIKNISKATTLCK